MAIHRKSRPEIRRRRKRKEKRRKLRAKGLNPDDFFSCGIYIKRGQA